MSLKTKERLAMLFMRDDDDAKRFLLYIVYQTIKKNTGITVNQICSLLAKRFYIPRCKIEAALAVLTNTQIFGAVSTYEEKPGIIHLHCKSSDDLNEWIADFCHTIPEVRNFDVPTYVGKGRVNDRTIITEI